MLLVLFVIYYLLGRVFSFVTLIDEAIEGSHHHHLGQNANVRLMDIAERVDHLSSVSASLTCRLRQVSCHGQGFVLAVVFSRVQRRLSVDDVNYLLGVILGKCRFSLSLSLPSLYLDVISERRTNHDGTMAN